MILITLPLEPKLANNLLWLFSSFMCVKIEDWLQIRKWCHERTDWQSSVSILKMYAEQSSLTKLHVNILKICQDSREYLVALQLVTSQQWHKHVNSFKKAMSHDIPSYHWLRAKANLNSSNLSLCILEGRLARDEKERKEQTPSMIQL